jgi:hypothetical protein
LQSIIYDISCLPHWQVLSDLFSHSLTRFFIFQGV